MNPYRVIQVPTDKLEAELNKQFNQSFKPIAIWQVAGDFVGVALVFKPKNSPVTGGD
jgi:hypothetical protein